MEKICKRCQKKFIPRKDAKGIFCSKRCNLIDARSRQIGTKNPHWKGGRYKATDGYIYIFIPDHPNAKPNGYYAEHRLIMEKKLGRNLLKTEVVHHMNHIPDDNRIENLMLMKSNGEHSSLHRKLHPYKRNNKGQYCGK